jgi:ABC-type phosphate transport system auxiliary subunit
MSNALSLLALPHLKTRLNRLQSDARIDDELLKRLDAAQSELQTKGVNLIESDADDQLILVDLAAYRYLNRDQPGAMPDWLRLRIRERWFSMKGRT